MAIPQGRPLPLAHAEYRPDVDGLRAFAAVAVLGFHIRVLPGGFIGVDVFFVISGYLISGLILRALRRGKFSIFDFYSRRTKRIFPALIAVLIASAVLGWLTDLSSEYTQLGKAIAHGAAFIRNFSMYPNMDAGYHDPAVDNGALGHLWSLGVEEQFYLLWPLFLLATWRFGRWQLLMITALTVISFLLNLEFSIRGPMVAYFLPWTRLWQLSMGAALAHFEQTSAPSKAPSVSWKWAPSWARPYSAHFLGAIGSALLVASCFEFDTPAPFPGWGALAPTTGAFLFIAAGMKSWINRHVFGAAPLVFIGLISYPLYLWHVPILGVEYSLWPRPTVTTTIGAVVVMFILAFVTYKYIEIPIRESRRSAITAGILCLTMLACGGVGYLMYSGTIPARPIPRGVERFVSATTEDWLSGTRGVPWTRDPGRVLALGRTSRYVLFIGDSHMQQYYPRIERILADRPQNSRGATFAVRDWCAPVESELPDSRATNLPCREFVRKTFKLAHDPGVEAVVIGACWRCYFSTDRSREAAKTDLALDELQNRVRDLVLAGKPVYLVLGIPIDRRLDPRSLIRRTIASPGFRVLANNGLTTAEVTGATKLLNLKLVKLAKFAGATVIDPIPSLCNEVTCSAVSSSGEPMYHDVLTLSPSYVRENVLFLDRTVLDAGANSAADTMLSRTGDESPGLR